MSATIRKLALAAYRVPTESPESDGTHQWDATGVVIVELDGGDARGIGYSYTDPAAARLIDEKFRTVVEGSDAFAISATRGRLFAKARNIGQTGIVSAAISAVDTALWDLKAKLLGVSLVDLFGPVREGAAVYGSGGFTSYSRERLTEQLAGWVEQGIPRVKMKVGRNPAEDAPRVRAAREGIGSDAELFVDANGAYDRKQALVKAEQFADCGATWYEEPVNSHDRDGLRLLRDRCPAGMEIASGEYGWDVFYFRDLIRDGAVDVLQADATRCGGFSGFLQAAALCEAHHLPFSSHCAPALHLHAACAAAPLRHMEWFYDHVRIERMFFDGFRAPQEGVVCPDRSRPGMGLELKRADAEKYKIWQA